MQMDMMSPPGFPIERAMGSPTRSATGRRARGFYYMQAMLDHGGVPDALGELEESLKRNELASIQAKQMKLDYPAYNMGFGQEGFGMGMGSMGGMGGMDRMQEENAFPLSMLFYLRIVCNSEEN